MSTHTFFSTEWLPDHAVLQIRQPVGSLADTQVMDELDGVITEIRRRGTLRLIVDFGGIAYFGSSLLEALRIVWNELHPAGGAMVLCHLSPVGREILEVAHFDQIWPILGTRQEAQAQLSGK